MPFDPGAGAVGGRALRSGTESIWRSASDQGEAWIGVHRRVASASAAQSVRGRWRFSPASMLARLGRQSFAK